MRRSWSLLALAVVLLVGCTAEGEPALDLSTAAVVVTSFDFSESELLAELYAQALEDEGVPVQRELRLGPRELVLPALQQGRVDVVPEYLGSAVTALSPESSAAWASRGPLDQVHARLDEALRGVDLRALAPAAAQNQNGLAVQRETAERLGLTTISDLAPWSGQLSLSGPAECPRRPLCLPGLRSAYGMSFARFVPYDGESQRLTALEQGVVDAAVVFTTNGHLAGGDLVLLEDDRRLQPIENVVPVVSTRVVERYGDTLVQALEEVSERLDSRALTFLSWRVEVAGGHVPTEARGWLLRHGLVRD